MGLKIRIKHLSMILLWKIKELRWIEFSVFL